MTIDELIKSLQEAKQIYGNVNVLVCDTEYVAHNITDISAMDELDERTPKEGYKDDYDSDCMEDTVQKELILWTTED